jgi:flagellar hook-associated protein 2
MATITAQGIGSGLDLKSLVDQLVTAERKPEDDRLSTKQTQANAKLSAVGQLKSALAGFRDALKGLATLDAFQGRKTTVSDDKIIKATATTTAQPANFQVEVTALATAQKLASGVFASSSTVIGNGRLTIQVGASTAVIAITDTNNTLAGIAAAINTAADNPGVRANVITAADGAHLVLSSTKTGAANSITIASADDNPAGPHPLQALEFGAGTTNSLTQLAPAGDATVKIDGFAVNSPTNSVKDAVAGLTLDLQTAAPGTLVDVAVSFDKDVATAAVNKFVSSYNVLRNVLGTVTAYNPATKSAAPLLGDADVRDIKDTIRAELAKAGDPAAASFQTLAQIGVTTAADGTLSVDKAKLSAAIDSNFDAVGNLFAGKSTGLAIRLQSVLDATLSSTGRLALRVTGLQDQLKVIATQKSRLDERMTAVQARYNAQFNALDTLISSLRTTSNFLTQQLGGLTKTG